MGLKAMWYSPPLAGLLLLTAGMSFPGPNRKSSQTFPPPSYKATSEFRSKQPLQTTTEPGAGHLSEPYRNVSCTPPVRFTRRQIWAYGFLAQFTEETFPLNVMVCDTQGKQVNSAHIAIPGISATSLIAVVPSMEGAAIVSGHGQSDPSDTFFLAKTSRSGGIVSFILTRGFESGRICEASDHTIWTLGSDRDKERKHDDNFSLVQQYSFEKGLLHGYFSKADSGLRDTQLLGNGHPSGGVLACGKQRISVYLNETNEYFEIDPSTETLKRWKMDAKPFPKGTLTGFAVTEKGRAYLSLFEDWRTETAWKFRRALFELRLEPNSGSGRWSLVNGTLSSSDPENIPDGIFFKLWGADGEDLVIQRLHKADMSWVRVIP